MLRALLVVLALAVALPPLPAFAEKRIALVIGNSAYPQMSLRNPVKDARAINAVLLRQGFETIVVENGKLDAMRRGVRQFSERLASGAVGLLYYAGHGIQVNGRNYMIPIDASLSGEQHIALEAMDVDVVLAQMVGAGTRVNVVILDACRDNPFERRFRGSSGGLAQMTAPEGTLIAYATAPGKVASDGAGDNGLYTGHLIEAMQEPGIAIEQVFKRVRYAVSRDSASAQVPWESSSLIGDFYFTGEPVPVASPSPPTAPPAPVSSPPPTPAAVVALPPLAPIPSPSSQTAPPKPGGKLAPGRTFKDCDACPEMVVIPKGGFLMGAPAAEWDAKDNEKPQNQVIFAKPFAISKYEVTFDEWDACVAAGGCIGYGDDEGWGRGRRPAINVSWRNARTFVIWLATTTGKSYRLPTEAEWEYAAKAGTKTRYAFGDWITSLDANYGDLRKTTEVGSYPANAWGLFDMHGNVWEWVEDCYADYTNLISDGSPLLAGDCSLRGCRGGSWSNGETSLRSAYRTANPLDYHEDNLGFRVARTLP